MSAPPYMRLYWADYHQDTRHLSRDEHGAYFLLLGEAWNRGGYLPDDDVLLSRWALATPDEWARLKPIVMAYFRPASKGRWRHKRISEELAAYEDVSRKRKAAGKRGGASKRGKDSENPEANATSIAEQKPTKPEPEPEPVVEERSIDLFVAERPQEVRPKSDPWAGDVEFLAAWKAVTEQMRRRSGLAKAWPLWRANPASGAAKLAALKAYLAKDPDVLRTGGPGFHLWLRDKLAQWLADSAPATGALGVDWTEGRWSAAVSIWRDDGSWDARLGPKPNEPGCRAPASLLIRPVDARTAA